jgi:lysophospholipase L1-like esterase
MWHKFVTVGLGPILWAQGRYVQRVTPRLAEPSGDREGVAGAGDELRVLIVGDSAAAGVGVVAQDEALSGQLISALAPEFRVSWKLFARTGWSTRTLLKRLDSEPNERFDIVVTSMGVNDVIAQVQPDVWRAQQLQLIELLETKFQADQIILSSVPPMHLFPALPQPLRWYLGQSAKRLNHELQDVAAATANCEFLTLDLPMDIEFMAADGFHPGAAGYSAWATELAQCIKSNNRQ